MEDSEKPMVEVIEEGRITKVPEIYALREGLPILRRIKVEKKIVEDVADMMPISRRSTSDTLNRGMVVDNFRRHDWKENQVLLELVENFHWMIRSERRKRGLSRIQFAKQIGEKDEYIRMLENGVLPTKDFVLINKVQDALKINLRKDNVDYSKTAHDLISDTQEKNRLKGEEKKKRAEREELKGIYGEESEILEED
jgi:ribosome-binding protein aMBF1 (putative translation factor)